MQLVNAALPRFIAPAKGLNERIKLNFLDPYNESGIITGERKKNACKKNGTTYLKSRYFIVKDEMIRPNPNAEANVINTLIGKKRMNFKISTCKW
jgi:hypothetical protein